MNRIDEFLGLMDQVRSQRIPAAVYHRAKLALLDYIGVTLAGRREHGEKVDALVASFCGSGEICPIGIRKALSVNDAVFLNGLNGHALDFDDGTNAGIIHLGSPIFSVLLALAQKYPISGEKLLEAAILGYEASFTMARSIQPAHKQRGYHATGTCGLLGIAIAVSHILDLDDRVRKEALSTAAVSATGTLKVLEDASQLKPYNVAKTAMLGITAVQMAMAGFKAADDAFSGTAGFLSQLYGDDQVAFVSPILGGTYAVEKAYIKPYAACRYTHPSIDIARDLRREHPGLAEEVESVLIKTYSLAVKKHDHTQIKGAASGKMSIPYNFAVTYVLGKTGMDAFTEEALSDRDVLALTKKIRVEEDAQMTAAFPEKTIATVQMMLRDGTVLEGRSVLPKGEPENPLTLEEVIGKFTSLAIYGGKMPEEAAAIVDVVLNIEDRLDELHSLL